MNKIKKSKRSTDAFVFALNEYKCGREKKPLRSKKNRCGRKKTVAVEKKPLRSKKNRCGRKKKIYYFFHLDFLDVLGEERKFNKSRFL